MPQRLSIRLLQLSLILSTILIGLWLERDAHTNQYLPKSVDLLTLSARELTDFLHNRTFTTTDLVKEYLHRIEIDNVNGLGLRAVLSLVPREILLAESKRLDEERQSGFIRSSFHGVPFFAKGNMASGPDLNMSTSAGAYALRDAVASADAFIIKRARDSGLLMLGKANLGEFGGFKDNDISPGWSKLGGETLSPYDLQHPCGSSAGPVAVVAAGFAPISLGTETQGSISCPASFTALYGLKASTGLLSRAGILPSSTSFDSPGMFAKSAWDIANLMSLVSGPDSNDPETSKGGPYIKNFTSNLNRSWADFRIGIIDRPWFWSINDGFSGDQSARDDEERMFRVGLDAVQVMSDLGAVIVDDVKMPSAALSNTEVPALMGRIIRHEMKSGTEKFLGTLHGTSLKTLRDLVEWNEQHPDLAGSKDAPGQKYLQTAIKENMSEQDYQIALSRAHQLGVEEGLDYVFEKYNLDAIVAPAWTQMSIYAAWSGAPTATVPLGVYENKRPYGLGFVARRFEDEKLMQIMHLYERTFPPRLVPKRMRWKRWESILPASWKGSV